MTDCAKAPDMIHCLYEAPLLQLYTLHIVWAFVIGMIGFGLLWHQVVNKKLPIFYCESGYFVRPKPIESMLLFLSLANILEVLKGVLSLTKKSPGLFLSTILHSLPIEFMNCAFSCYLFGILHTVYSTCEVGPNRYKTLKRIDIICTIFIGAPFIFNMICTIILMMSAKQRDFRAILTNVIVDNAQKLLNSFILSVWILVAGLQLIGILKKCLHNQSKEGSGNNVSIEAIRHGLFKVRVTMAIGISFMVIIISLHSTQIFMVFNHCIDIVCWVCFTILLYSPALCTTLIVIIIFYNPKALNPLSGSSSTSQSYNNAEVTEPGFTEHLGESTLVANHVETPNLVFKS